ncbi:hypothetical protein MPTK1_3g22060 [Marchantia polymorpha subsp. ruderalis]|uniref:Uncharacterized protein n=2 Tax=Marchantia polymorpha TaxID=3197 RepID=A0AAF6B3G2_MARPO|nr:hypothetical protein MARPO_0089s0011 [Marchantia polymorpha]BBN06546.1 hypothetical protein Mp_3g22060 [Marchantia polymorpha subsp. ruderalis]|eukprot:PTQ33373.1 hypothetical protein MARPO_0089s0011 [Marchantia polymorpha]
MMIKSGCRSFSFPCARSTSSLFHDFDSFYKCTMVLHDLSIYTIIRFRSFEFLKLQDMIASMWETMNTSR